jgi:hypothetical protein
VAPVSMDKLLYCTVQYSTVQGKVPRCTTQLSARGLEYHCTELYSILLIVTMLFNFGLASDIQLKIATTTDEKTASPWQKIEQSVLASMSWRQLVTRRLEF